MTPSGIRRRADQITWWHPIDLGGYVVPARCPSAATTLALLSLGDLTGKSVLDIGAWDGFYSFAAERAGAARVLATDSYVWQRKSWGSKDGFLLAREALGSKVEDLEIDVMDLDPAVVGTFDVVFFLGVLYHLRHPLLGLERVVACTASGGTVHVESHVDLGLKNDRPMCAFYPGAELANDASNWWGPNPKALVALVQSAGLSVVDVYNGCVPGRMIVRAVKP